MSRGPLGKLYRIPIAPQVHKGQYGSFPKFVDASLDPKILYHWDPRKATSNFGKVPYMGTNIIYMMAILEQEFGSTTIA